MWPGPEGGGLESGGGSDPLSCALSIPEGDSPIPTDPYQRTAGDRVQKLNPEDQRKQNQLQGTKSRLALIQSRTKSKRESTLIRSNEKNPKVDQADSSNQSDGKNPTPADKKRQSNKANKGKVNMVREQLEQNRLRFERRGQEMNETAKTMEVKLEHLRQQLEERDVSIQQLQLGEIPSVELLPEPVNLNELLKERDAKIAELTQKAADLENTILDMQENLKEKDAVIEARTQAITLLSEDLSKKRKTTVDTLEETRQQMKIMQENFVGIEAGLTAEIEQLTKTLETKNEKLQQLEFSVAQAEEVRVKLMVRNAELEEKLSLSSSQPGESFEELKLKVEELTNLLDEANKKGVAFQAEKKALSKQLKILKKESNTNEEIVKLQNHVAELEEEKGNLQLHLIDFDDLTASESAWQKRVEELEIKLKQQSEDLENHVHMITLLESDKLEVMTSLHEQSRELDELRNYVSELEKGKGTETRAVDLDEPWSVVQSPKSDDSALLQELAEASLRLSETEKRVVEQDELIQELKTKMAQMAIDRDDQQSTLASLPTKDVEDQESIVWELKQKLKESEGALEEWKLKSELIEAELESVRSELERKEEILVELQVKHALYEQTLTYRVEDAERDLKNRKVQIQELESCVRGLAVQLLKSSMKNDGSFGTNSADESLMEKNMNELESELSGMVAVQQGEVRRRSVSKEPAATNWNVDPSGQSDEDVWKWDTFEAQQEQPPSDAQAIEPSDVVNVVEVCTPLESQFVDQQEEDKMLQKTTDSLRLEIQKRDETVLELHKLLEEKSNLIEELHEQLQISSLNQEEQRVKILEAETMVENLKSQLVSGGMSAEPNAQPDEMIALKGALELKNEECQRLEAKLRTQAEKLKKALVNLKVKTVANNDLTDKVTKLQTVIESNQVQLDNLSKDKNEILEKWQTESSEKIEVMNALANVRNILEGREREIIELTKQLETKDYLLVEIRADLDDKVVELGELEASLADKTAQLAALKEQCAMSDVKEPEEAARDAAAKDAQITKLQNVAKSYKVKLAKEKKAHLEVEEKLNGLEQTLAEKSVLLEEAVEKLSQQNYAFEAKVQEYEAYVDSLKQELDRERQQLCHLSESFAETEHRCKDLENYCQRLEQQIGEAHTQGANKLENELNRRRLEAEDRERSMVRELHNLRDENKELSQNLNETELKVKALQMELCAAVGQVSEMTKESERRAVWEEEANTAADDLRALEAKIKNMSREHKQLLDDQISESNQVRESLQSELDDTREHQSKLEAEVNLLRDQINAASRIQQELTEDVQQKETELEETRQIMSGMEVQRVQQVAEMTTDLEKYKSRVSELEEISSTTANSFPDTAEETSAASARISELNTTVEALTGELEMMKARKKSECHDVIDERPSIPQELDTHVTAIQLVTSLNSMVLELEAELNQVWSERDQALAQIDQLMNNSVPRDESFTTYNMDESLMEKNMNQLESELCGMVTSQQDGVQRHCVGSAGSDGSAETGWSMEPTGKSDADVWKWDTARPETTEHLKEKFSALEQRIKKKLSRMSLHLKQGAGDNRNLDDPVRPYRSDEHTPAEDRYQKLTSQIKELETERNDAFSQIKMLRTEMDKMTSGMEKGLPLGESSVAPTPTIESAPGWDVDDPDGWGWGDKTEDEIREPVKLEETPSEQMAALQGKVNTLESEREQWETQRVKLAEDLKVAQVRSAKLVKKLKEMKQKYETTKVSTSSNLDQALEEEFLIQIKNLEKDLSEAQTELTSIRSERDSLVRQVQVLTSGNERLVEMKERQDFEVEMWQKRSDDLTKKVTALEWEIAELKNEKPETGERPFGDLPLECPKCADLEKQLALLSEESGALQALLTKQKEDQVLSGKGTDMNPVAVEQLMKEAHTWSSKYEKLMQEYQQVRAQCIADTEKITKMEPVVAELTGAVERLENEKKYIQDVHDSLKMEFESVNAQLRQTQEVLIRERNARDEELSTKHLEENLLREKYQEVCSENEQIRDRCRKLEDQVKDISEVAACGTEIDQLKYHLSVQGADLVAREQRIEELTAEISDLKTRLQSAMNEASTIKSDRSRLTDEMNALMAENNAVQGRLESEITLLKNQLSEHAKVLASKEQNIERLETQLLDAWTHMKSAADQAALLQAQPVRIPVVGTSAVRSTADWFSSHAAEQGHHVGTPPTSVLNWDAILSGGPGADVFDTIVTKTDVSLTTQAPPAQAPPAPALGSSQCDLEAKEAELQKMTRLVETLKLTHSEAEQEWNRAIEYNKSQLQTSIEELERVKEVLSVRERELCGCREDLERSTYRFQEELANRDRELKSKEGQIESLRADISEREGRMCALQEGELSQLQLQLAEKDQLLLQVQAKRDHDLSEANQQITDLKTKLSQKDWQMTEITMARERELAMRDEAKGKELKEQIAEKDQQFTEERQRLQAQIEALQMTADQQASTIHQLQSQLASDSPALEEMRLFAEKEGKTIQDLRIQIEVLDQELNDTRQYSHQQANTLQSLRHHLQANEDELARLRSSEQKLIEVEKEIEQLRVKVADRETTIERLQASIQWMEQERASLRSSDDFFQLESNLLSKEHELLTLRQELALKEEFVLKLQAEVQMKDTEIQELQDKIQRLEMKRMWDAEVKANREAAAKLEMTALAGGDAANKGIRSDLDQALNMLHQRDVRCEELTLELMRLLEERDSLQLRLSSALRINEDLRSKLKKLDVSPNVSVSALSSNQGPHETASSLSLDGSAVVADAAVDSEGNAEGLANKLAELKRVGYSRDVRIKDESELRHKEQMRLMTSSPSILLPTSISVVSSSNLKSPPTDFTTVEGTGAAVDLVAGNLEAQDEQSSSLLDWFWGRSSHQIVDI